MSRPLRVFAIDGYRTEAPGQETREVAPSPDDLGKQRCAECGGWTSDPDFHSERYQHRFKARA